MVLARKPRPRLLALLLVAALAGCGGGKPAGPASKSVQGEGFSFTAAPSWVVSSAGNSTSASHGVDRLEVLRFTLEKTYRPALFAPTARELDSVAARLATSLGGRVATGSTVRVAGQQARSYRLLYGRERTLEIAFVLSGKTEYELLCRRLVRTPDTACRQFFGTFALG